MSDHPIEALLRPPVELWSAFTSACVAAICVGAPHQLLMSTRLGQAVGAAFALVALYRARQGLAVIAYQRNLRRLKTYTLDAGQVPVSRKKLFLGMGFRWSQIHTQRLRDTERPWAKR